MSTPDISEHRDALSMGPVRGRGAGLNPGNRFDDRGGGGVRLHVLGEHLDELHAEREGTCPHGVQVPTRTIDDDTRRIINRVDSPDLPFHWTLNPYRGCEHGCVYCYARPTHEMLGFSCGLDFETQIVVKRNAPTLLRRELASSRWHGEPIVMSGVTDPYQPQERELNVTRGCLEVMVECRQPVALITKSRLVVRDLDLLRELDRHDAVSVAISLTTLDDRLARDMEPRASSPRDRLRAVRELADAGIPVGVMIAPIIPGLTDHEIPRLLEASAQAGAVAAGRVLLHLPHQVRDIFLEWLRRTRPERAARVEAAIRSTRGGAISDERPGARFRGEGPLATHIAQTFGVFCRRYGLRERFGSVSSDGFRRPAGLRACPDRTLPLFDRL